MRYATTINDHTYVIEINRDGEITIDGETSPIDLRAIDEVTYSLLIEHRSHEALIELAGDTMNVLLNGRLYGAQVQDERARRLTQASGGGTHSGEVQIKSPMPGLIVATPVSEGRDREERPNRHRAGVDEDGERTQGPARRDGGRHQGDAAPERGTASGLGDFDVTVMSITDVNFDLRRLSLADRHRWRDNRTKSAVTKDDLWLSPKLNANLDL